MYEAIRSSLGSLSLGCLCLGFVFLLTGSSAASTSDWENVSMVNYAQVEDLPGLRALGVNTVLMELEHNPRSWKASYRAVAQHKMKMVPLLWGKHQSIWKWNKTQAEWELDPDRYPKSTGAQFIKFLQTDAEARTHTFALYSFHEPWYLGDGKKKRKGTVPPERQRQFWQQVRDLFGPTMKVYGEEVAWVPECKNGCVDYDYVTLYSFAQQEGRPGYRPGGRFQVGAAGIDGGHAPFQNDKQAAQKQEREQIGLMHKAIRAAPAAPDGSRTKLIALMGTFAHDEEPGLWNRMPTAEEMREWGREIIHPSRKQLAGVGWYAFRNPTDYYDQVLFNARTDPNGKDRWKAVGDVSKLLREAPPPR